jgi:hypothetical protein
MFLKFSSPCCIRDSHGALWRTLACNSKVQRTYAYKMHGCFDRVKDNANPPQKNLQVPTSINVVVCKWKLLHGIMQ